MSKKVMLCAICNVSSGNCGEDCAYCTQSVHHETNTNKSIKVAGILYINIK